MALANPERPEQKKEVYGDPIRFRLASEYWHIVDELEPKVLAALEYLTEHKSIDEEWREVLEELGSISLGLKYAVVGFTFLLTKEDSDTIRNYNECYFLGLRRDGRAIIQHGVMEGRAELLARRRLQLEDRAIALFYQTMDIRAVAFKNKMWDMGNRPQTKEHGIDVRRGRPPNQ